MLCLLAAGPVPAPAKLLDLPPRPANAPTGTQFTNIIATLSRSEREQWIYAQIISGNVPGWLRVLQPVSVSGGGHTATYYVTPDYLAIGSETDYFRTPMTPLLAQRLADRLGCSLPTRRMVNQIWTNAPVKLSPVPFNPAVYDIQSVAVFAASNFAIDGQRNLLTNAHPLGALVGGSKKDVIISARIYTNFANGPTITKPVVIYGWHYLNGTYIQPLYNGHEETYVDYSHGIRLVQMNLLVDGHPDTLTNVLTSPALCQLLSDDGAAEGSSDGTIPVPRYTVASQAPVMMRHPASHSALPGATVELAALAIGDPPLHYQWRHNQADLPQATNATLSISSLTPASAGAYTVVAANAVGATTSRVAVVRLRTSAFPLLFQDDLDLGAAERWDIFWGANNGIPDYTVAYDFDYGVIPYTFNGVTALIPPAPNTTDGCTRGLRLAVNTDGVGANAAVNLYPREVSVSGNFALKFDLWINYPGNTGGTGSGVAGSTQHALCGIDHWGTQVNWAAPAAPASDGIWFAVTGEGGDSRDYRAYVGNPAGPPVELVTPALSGLVGTNHLQTVYQNFFPAGRFETPGAPGKNWVEVELRQTNNTVLWLMDGNLIAQRPNATPFTQGNVMLGLMDLFPSIAAPARDSFVLIDNVRVENLSPPIHFTAISITEAAAVRLTISSALGDQFQLEVSDDLLAWRPLVGVVMTNQPLTFVDPQPAAGAPRYYRARR